jgi:calcineurin-like phosphoesterase family protein
VPGNHDKDKKRALEIFDCEEGCHDFKGYQIISFADSYGSDQKSSRNWEDMKCFFDKASDKGMRIVLQHPVIFPNVEDDYPYNIEEKGKIKSFYADNGVKLSLSGHFHRGIAPIVENGVCYITCGAMCEHPFRFSILTLDGDKFKYEPFALEI